MSESVKVHTSAVILIVSMGLLLALSQHQAADRGGEGAGVGENSGGGGSPSPITIDHLALPLADVIAARVPLPEAATPEPVLPLLAPEPLAVFAITEPVPEATQAPTVTAHRVAPTAPPRAPLSPQNGHTVPADAWSTIAAIAPGREAELIMIGICESGMNPAMRGFDPADGAPIAGTFSVKTNLHGPVPPTLAGQVEQFLQIEATARRAGMGDPWAATRHGCGR